MAALHVVFNRQHVDPDVLPGKVAIVVDLLFATTSIVAALAHGAKEVVPALDAEAAHAAAAGRAAGSFVLAGEWHGVTIEGFVDPYPSALISHGLAGRALIYSTTNGTVALQRTRSAGRVYAAALLNGDAIARHVVAEHRNETVVLVCAGAGASFNLEDFYGAGYLVSLIAAADPSRRLSDTALAALMCYEGRDPYDCLRRSRAGSDMLKRGLGQDIEFAARRSVYSVVPLFSGGRVEPVSG